MTDVGPNLDVGTGKRRGVPRFDDERAFVASNGFLDAFEACGGQELDDRAGRGEAALRPRPWRTRGPATPQMRKLVEFFAREVEERGGEKKKHDEAEEIVRGEGAEEFGTEGEEVGMPREAERGREPVRDAVRDFGVLKETDDDAKEAEDAAGGDETAGIKRAGTGFAVALLFFLHRGFDEPAHETTGEHGGGGRDGDVQSGGEGERANAENFDGDHHSHAH